MPQVIPPGTWFPMPLTTRDAGMYGGAKAGTGPLPMTLVTMVLLSQPFAAVAMARPNRLGNGGADRVGEMTAGACHRSEGSRILRQAGERRRDVWCWWGERCGEHSEGGVPGKVGNLDAGLP